MWGLLLLACLPLRRLRLLLPASSIIMPTTTSRCFFQRAAADAAAVYVNNSCISPSSCCVFRCCCCCCRHVGEHCSHYGAALAALYEVAQTLEYCCINNNNTVPQLLQPVSTAPVFTSDIASTIIHTHTHMSHGYPCIKVH